MTNFTPVEQQAVNNGGLYNGARYDLSSNPYGFSGSGYLTLFPQALNDSATMLNAMSRLSNQVDANTSSNAQVAVNGPKATSATNQMIATGSDLVFSLVELGAAARFLKASWVKISKASDLTAWMWGTVDAVDTVANKITVNPSLDNGSGSSSSWIIVATGPQGPATGISSLSADPSPKLGADLHSNGHTIYTDSNDQQIFASDSLGSNFQGSPLARAVSVYCSEKLTDIGAVMNTVILDPTTGHKMMLLAGNTTFILPNNLRVGELIGFQVWVKQASASPFFSLTHDSRVHWTGGGSQPTMTQSAGATDIYTFLTKDGGANWVGTSLQGMAGL